MMQLRYSKDLYKIIPPPMTFAPVPTARDTFWRTQIPSDMIQDYIELGNHYLGKPWLPIPNHLFAEYKTIGNRTNYESRCFALRRQLACLVMAEIMEYKGRFIDDIINGLDYFVSEIWWGVPAHYPESHLIASVQTVDLFNAATANLLAWTIYMLQPEIEKKDIRICRLIREEINRRILVPAMSRECSWKKKRDNWNPWICSNWISCVLFCEKDRNSQIEAIRQILECMDLFYDGYTSDGGCDEGVLYWGKAVASFYDCLLLLGLASNNYISLVGDKKLQLMEHYPLRMYIGNHFFVNFADSKPQTLLLPQVCLPFGNYTNDSIMMQYAMAVAHKYNYQQKPSFLFNISGNFPVISRELLFLSKYHSFKDIIPAEPFTLDEYLENLEVCTARSWEGRKDGLYVAVKGGHNAENHNHNDVGSYVVYDNGNPVLIDIGQGIYTAQTFSPQRYELFNCRSAFHNVPLINGFEQHYGKMYKATNNRYKKTAKFSTYTLDIAKAYPDEAGVLKWERTIRLNRKKNIIISEKYVLNEFKGQTKIVLICFGKPEYVGHGLINIIDGNVIHHLRFNPKLLKPEIEFLKYEDASIRNTWKGNDIYRIFLDIISQSTRGMVSYSID